MCVSGYGVLHSSTMLLNSQFSADACGAYRVAERGDAFSLLERLSELSLSVSLALGLCSLQNFIRVRVPFQRRCRNCLFFKTHVRNAQSHSCNWVDFQRKGIPSCDTTLASSHDVCCTCLVARARLGRSWMDLKVSKCIYFIKEYFDFSGFFLGLVFFVCLGVFLRLVKSLQITAIKSWSSKVVLQSSTYFKLQMNYHMPDLIACCSYSAKLLCSSTSVASNY